MNKYKFSMKWIALLCGLLPSAEFYHSHAQCNGPSIQVKELMVQDAGTSSVVLSWVRGNGEQVMLLASSTGPVSSFPVQGNSYTASSVFGNGSSLGSGVFVVYSGSAGTATISNLLANTGYHFIALEFNENSTPCYNLEDAPMAYVPCRPVSANGGRITQVVIRDSLTTEVVLSNQDTSFTPDNYQNFYSQTPANLMAGKTYRISLAREGSGQRRCNVLIDLNGDGLFSLATPGPGSETIYNLAPPNLDTISFYYRIPEGLAAGIYRLRFRSFAQASAIGICLPANVSGETEDYLIKIAATSACPVNIQASQTSVCPGDSIILKASGASSYSWTSAAGLLCNDCDSVWVKPTETTQFTVIGNSDGCSDSAVISITLLDGPPIADFSFEPVGNNQVQFQYSGTSANTYTWLIDGVVSSTLQNPLITPASAGNILVKLIVGNSCGTDTLERVIQVTRLDKVEDNLAFLIFPNPVSEWLNFKMPENSGEITLEVFSISGQRVMHTTLFAPLEALQVGHLPVGLYLVKLTDGKGRSVTQRLVLAR